MLDTTLGMDGKTSVKYTRRRTHRLDELSIGLRIMFSRHLLQTWEEFIGFVTMYDKTDGSM
jgi:hypothetical protein